jgi:3-methyladenine DNA glycosylase AlkD
LPEIWTILRSPWHEERLFALLLLVDRYKRSGNEDRTLLFFQYLARLEYVNNWDLVDCSAPYIVGAYLLDKDATLLTTLTGSGSIWERRIAIIATFAFIRQNRFDECLLIAGLLRNDPHDLIHKAVGWMLREVGKRDQATAEKFLRLHYQTMPRTMLRYAIERYPQPVRQRYLGRPVDHRERLR